MAGAGEAQLGETGWMPLCEYATDMCLSMNEFSSLASVVAPPGGTVHDYVMIAVVCGGLPVDWSIVFKDQDDGFVYRHDVSGATQADHPLLTVRSVSHSSLLRNISTLSDGAARHA